MLAGQAGALVKSIVPRCRVVLDLRGSIAEQAGPGSTAHAALVRELGRVVHSADAVICVSEPLRGEIVAWFPDAVHKTRVIPCAASAALFTYDPQKRCEVRRRLRVVDRVVLINSGRLMAPWHVAGQLVGAFSVLHAANPAYHLLLVTPDVERARALVSETGIDGGRVTIVSASHAEVPDYLMAADVGLLLRRRDSVNAVASPTKLAEYLMTGLPVAISEGIGDAEELVRANEFGALIPDINDTGAVEAAVHAAANMPSSDEARAARAARAARLLSSERYLPTRLEIYGATSAPEVH